MNILISVLIILAGFIFIFKGEPLELTDFIGIFLIAAGAGVSK